MKAAVDWSKLDPSWVDAAIHKRRANYSTVLCLATTDPIRREQAIAVIRGTEDLGRAPFYCYDPWRGMALRAGGRLEPVKRGARDAYDTGVGEPILDLRDALRYADDLLRKGPHVFFLSGLDAVRPEEKLSVLADALRSWAHDPIVMSNGSTIVLFVGATDRVLDELTLDLVSLHRAPLSSREERGHIAGEVARMLGVRETDMPSLVQATAGLSIHQLRSILTEAYYRRKDFDRETIRDLKAELIRRSDVVEIDEVVEGGFRTVGGYDAVKRFVSENIVRVLKDPERASRFALPLPRGLLLFGPPGTGKTLFARALARESTLPFINLRTENLFSKYLGESGQRFAEAIRLVEQMSPAIVFIDEIDRFGARRGGASDGASEETRRVFNQVLEWLGSESRKAIVLGTTNRPGDLDAAFLRPGRLDYKVPFLYPDREARVQILQIHLGLTGARPRPAIALDNEQMNATLAKLAASTERFSGAELEELVTRAKRHAFSRGADALEASDLDRARHAIRIDEKERDGLLREFLAHARRFTDDANFLEALESQAGLAPSGS